VFEGHISGHDAYTRAINPKLFEQYKGTK
jgi:hypothetical protein